MDHGLSHGGARLALLVLLAGALWSAQAARAEETPAPSAPSVARSGYWPSLSGTVPVIMPCRVTLVPWTLDTVRKVLERDLDRKISLSVRSETAFHWPDPGAAEAWLLLEEGTPAPAGLHPTATVVTLYWMLGVRSDALARVASGCPRDLGEFFETLTALRTSSPGLFPWFESLYSPGTLRCFTLAFGLADPSPPGAGGECFGVPSPPDAGDESFGGRRPAHPSPRARDALASLRFFHRALDRKLLNPLSIESDEGLAFDVFEAGDAAFSSLWVVEDAWQPGSLLRGTLAGALFIPVPGLTGPSAVPQMVFRLWSRQASADREKPVPAARTAFPFPVTRLDPKMESAWTRDAFPRVYDQLIQGGTE